jgi:hypothetical protein
MTLATPQLVNVVVLAPGLYWALASYALIPVVLIVGGIWGFRIGDGGGRGDGGSKRPPRREPPPSPGGPELPADFATWEAQLRAASAKTPAGDQEDPAHTEDDPLRVG